MVYDTFFNPPPSRTEEYYWPEEEDRYECPVCGAPFGSCMDIVFTKSFGLKVSLDPSETLETSEDLIPFEPYLSGE